MQQHLLMVAGCVIAAGACWAEPMELVTDRPDQTESAVVVAPGHVQVETGALYSGEGDGSLSAPTTLVRIGWLERLELRLGLPAWTEGYGDTEAARLGDSELGAKLRLWDEAGLRPEAALLFGVSLPTGNGDNTTDAIDPGLRLSFAHTLSERVSLGYNAGVAWATEEVDNTHAWPVLRRAAATDPWRLAWEESGDTHRHTRARFEYTAALGFGITERLGAFIEVFGDAPLNGGDGAAHSFDGGFTYLLRPNVQLDISGGVGLNDAAEDWFIGAGVSFRLPR